MSRQVFVYRPGHPLASARGFVNVNELGPEPEKAINAPICTDRFMENSQATDGTDIGSRARRREYMKREGVTDKSDYQPDWTDRVRKKRDVEQCKATRDTVARIVYREWKP